MAAEAALGFLAESPLSRPFGRRVQALGDRGLRAEETHRYFEVFGATMTGLSFRANFLGGVFLLSAAEGGPAGRSPAFKPDVCGGMVFAAGEEPKLGCLSSTLPTFWLFTQVNFDLFRKAALTWE